MKINQRLRKIPWSEYDLICGLENRGIRSLRGLMGGLGSGTLEYKGFLKGGVVKSELRKMNVDAICRK